MLIFPCKLMLLKSGSISKLVIKGSELKFLDVLALEKNWSKHGKPAVTIFRTLAKPYIVPDFTPEGRKSLSRSLEINFFGPQIFQNILFSIFRIDKPI